MNDNNIYNPERYYSPLYASDNPLPELNMISLDECEYYMWYLNIYANTNCINLPPMLTFTNNGNAKPEISNYHSYINQQIQRICNYDKNTVNSFIKIIMSSYKQYLEQQVFNLKEIEWLKNNSRACFWFWLKLIYYQEIPIGYIGTNYDPINYYTQLNLSHNPVGNKARYENIEKFMRNAQILDKYLFWNNLKDQWDYLIKDNIKCLSWLKKDDINQRNWAINYLIEKCNLQENTLLISSVINDPDLPLSVIVDNLNETPLAKIGLMKSMNSAWNQLKVRERKKDKKAINTYISKEHKRKLDILCKDLNLPIQNIIEILIDKYPR